MGYRLYDYRPSGNGYKVRLVAALLGIDLDIVELDIDRRETRTPAFLEKNPNGRVPLLEMEDGRRLAESNAIMLYLAEGSPLVPQDRFVRAQMMQWLFFEQYSHEPNVATSRYWITHGLVTPERQSLLAQKQEAGRAALALMDRHLARQPFFVAGRYGLADIALYAYTHVAADGGFDLDAYPALQSWLARVAAQPGHMLITDAPHHGGPA